MAREVTREAFAAAWVDGARVVDVREPTEYTAGYVPRVRPTSLRTMPVGRGQLPADRMKLVICASGNRSKTAAWTNPRGIDASSVADGTSACARGGPSVAAGSHEHAG